MRGKLPLLWLMALAACDKADPPPPPVQTAQLTGLYEGPAEGSERSRLCMTAEATGQAAFGIVVFGPAGAVCSGAGQAVRDGEVVRLEMGGDEACLIEARLGGTDLEFPATVAPGCAYYCAPGGTLAGAAFTKTGGAAADALRARDLAGDALCG